MSRTIRITGTCQNVLPAIGTTKISRHGYFTAKSSARFTLRDRKYARLLDNDDVLLYDDYVATILNGR